MFEISTQELDIQDTEKYLQLRKKGYIFHRQSRQKIVLRRKIEAKNIRDLLQKLDALN